MYGGISCLVIFVMLGVFRITLRDKTLHEEHEDRNLTGFDDGEGDDGILGMRQGEMNGAILEGLGNLPIQDNLWGAGGLVHHLDIFPPKMPRPSGLHGLSDSLLRCKSGRKVFMGVLLPLAIADFLFREHLFEKRLSLSGEGLLEPLDIHNVNTNALNNPLLHAWAFSFLTMLINPAISSSS